MLTLRKHREALNTYQQRNVSQSVLAQVRLPSRMDISATLSSSAISQQQPAAGLSLEEAPTLQISEHASSLLLLPGHQPRYASPKCEKWVSLVVSN